MESNSKYYLSGPISGVPGFRHNFKQAAKQALKMDRVETVISPVDIGDQLALQAKEDLTWSMYMRADIMVMMGCSGIAMLDGWRSSKGATIEHDLAVDLGFDVVYLGLD